MIHIIYTCMIKHMYWLTLFRKACDATQWTYCCLFGSLSNHSYSQDTNLFYELFLDRQTYF